MNPDRYLKINTWLRKRYTVDGWLTVHDGNEPTRYTKLDILAFRRYITGTN